MPHRYLSKGFGKRRILKILNHNDQIHFFLQLGVTLYHRAYELGAGISSSDTWESVGSVYQQWQAVSNDEGLFVFSLHPSEGRTHVVVYIKKNNAGQADDSFYPE